jgi:hypothetical protein
MENEEEKAELIQSVKALMIPLSLFLATIITSAGGFLVYSGYSLGYGFVGVGLTMLTAAFVAAIKFQNKLRAKGKFRRVVDRDQPQASEKTAEPEASVR